MHKKILFTLLPLFGFLSVMGISEVWLRNATLHRDFVQFLFFTEFKISRWSYLNQLKGRLLIDQVLQTIPGTTYIEPPEANRPPFDRVPYPYEVAYNNMGFRDHDFQLPKSTKKRVIVLGDSVAFGKGVGVVGQGADAEGVGIKRVAGVDMQIAPEDMAFGALAGVVQCGGRLVKTGFLHGFQRRVLLVARAGFRVGFAYDFGRAP